MLLLAGVIIWLAVHFRPAPEPPDPVTDYWNTWQAKFVVVDTPEGKRTVQVPGTPPPPRMPAKRAASGRRTR
jgi:hypothetical protein